MNYRQVSLAILNMHESVHNKLYSFSVRNISLYFASTSSITCAIGVGLGEQGAGTGNQAARLALPPVSRQTGAARPRSAAANRPVRTEPLLPSSPQTAGPQTLLVCVCVYYSWMNRKAMAESGE